MPRDKNHGTRALLEQIIHYPLKKNNTDALVLQVLAAKALLKLSVRPKVSQKTVVEAGRNGGTVRAERLSPERRSAIARKAAVIRWSKSA